MIDVIASFPWYAAHLRPIWDALPETERGRWIVPRRGAEHELRGDDPVLVAGWVDYHRAVRAGRTRIAETQHGIGQSYSVEHHSYPGGQGRQPGSLFLVPNEHAANRWRRTYPASTVAVVGSPRLDALPAYEPEGEPVVCVSSHWEVSFVPEGRSGFRWIAPAIPALAERFRVIGHAHPRIADTVARWYRQHGIEFVEDFDEVVRRAAVYVTDNSSSLYEFAATGRPVVALSPPFYRRNVEHGLRFWEAARVGINVEAPDDLADAVALALDDPPALRSGREAALGIVYAYRTGASARAASALERWAGWYRGARIPASAQVLTEQPPGGMPI